ncbi:ATP-binding cassette domain-containing protein [Winogradskyella sp. DF17]|uniref:ATP-binding cassette domain-containing protein n=1 Tax=Winogradskyella pelagia TaxID=2819984 RepID=A0ABS3T0J4_9FLAO|nr:ATP-binding cassette domain-containing protein [Winogradskyella sp. DF17]MBO3116263.1 ATP-binding cassette domain-containing protein [Winogradskyella sp. DF17]
MTFEIDNVELYFKTKRILNGIYLKAETGKVTAILGSNGCGKSCLMDIIFGDLKPKYKLIRIDGKPILKQLYKTGLVKYLPQDYFVLKHLKLNFTLKLFNSHWSDFSTLFPEFGNYQTTKFKQLSGGERRIFEMFLILKSNAKIVLLDEPFNGISPLMIERIKTLIEEEKQDKIIILTDHRFDDVIDVSDTLYLLKNGATKRIQKLSELEDYEYLNKGTLLN